MLHAPRRPRAGQISQLVKVQRILPQLHSEAYSFLPTPFHIPAGKTRSRRRKSSASVSSIRGPVNPRYLNGPFRHRISSLQWLKTKAITSLGTETRIKSRPEVNRNASARPRMREGIVSLWTLAHEALSKKWSPFRSSSCCRAITRWGDD